MDAQQARLLAQQLAVKFVDRYTSSETCLSLSNSAKGLSIPPMTLNRSREEDRSTFRNQRKVLEPYADFIQRGFFVVSYPTGLCAGRRCRPE
ncbi:phage antirepressor KilAC domain-containing protein [Corallococcus carmarthensis]